MLGCATEYLACTASQAAPNFRADKAPEINFSATLKLAGIEFIDENGGGQGVRLRDRQRPKSPNSRSAQSRFQSLFPV